MRGSITDNAATSDAGGVYVAPDNTVAISDSVIVDDNTAGRNTDNIYLLFGSTVTIGQLGSTAKIDFYTYEKPEEDGELLVASPAEGYTLTADDLSKLSYEDTDYCLQLSSGKVILTEPPYSIAVETLTNGEVTTNKKKAAEGDIITVTVTPADHYELDTLSITDEDGNLQGNRIRYQDRAQRSSRKIE